ncbi:MAG: 2-dehydro-3-deoxyglucarate aldolase [Fibrobacteres bacterium]|nr:2-dehydro-3-deoxyglucarate aldolase [Fibrobacterota bacterium]
MNLLEKLSGKTGAKASIGSWLTMSDQAIPEIMSRAGFEWLVVDMEHSPLSMSQAVGLIRVIDLCGCVPLVRMSANDATQIKRVMDGGAKGVIVPMVNTAQEAKQVVDAVKYPPTGRRGVGLARAQGYGTSFPQYRDWLEEGSIVIVQVEHIRAVENLEEILAVKGVDGFIIGPYDLSASLGTPGDFANPRMVAALEKIKGFAKSHTAGVHVVQPEPDEVKNRLADGYGFVAYSVDFLLLGETCRTGFRRIQSAINGEKG